jgi:predicted 3-demethylubiquinone-9 3-methyltransferase (glyoxalase superfamily)
MPTKLNPYINFRNNARQAMEFYKEVFGGDLRLQTFKEFNASTDPSEDNLIMHAELDAVVCSGPRRGGAQTYALVADRVPPSPGRSRDEGLAELREA